MKKYQEMLHHILDNGTRTKNRTGIDTIALSGMMFEHDMSEGFPLVTSRQCGYKYVAAELEMFLHGITSKKFLQDRKAHLWDAWCNPEKVPYGNDDATKARMAEEDDLGKIYGYNWINFESDNNLVWVYKREAENDLDKTAPVGSKERFTRRYGDKLLSKMKSLWEKLKGKMSEGWENSFELFLDDIQLLPNFAAMLRWPDRYTLDISYYGADKYASNTAVWLQDTDITRNNSILVLDVNGKPADTGDMVRRTRLPSNQLLDAINTIKADPTSRRLIASAWNPTQLDSMALPPCHFAYELLVYPDEGTIDLIWFQRSCDFYLGIPADITSYGLLLTLIAKETGYKPGKLIGMLGSCHIYENQIEAAKELIERPTYSLPTLKIENWTSIWNWEYSDTVIENYQHGPKLSVDVAV